MNYVDSELKPVAEDVRNNFLHLKCHLRNLRRVGRVQLLYRGEELSNIQKRLATKKEDEIYEHAFYVGEKARHFSIDRFELGRDYLTHISDDSEKTFLFILNRIRNVIGEHKLSIRVRKNTTDKFRKYFLSSSSDVDFLEKINNCTGRERISVRDYYLYFLHVAGSVGIRKEAMLVSTSKNKRIALKFSGSADKKKNKKKVILHYFVPKPFHDYAIGPDDIYYHRHIIKKINLPEYYAKGLFPEQNEIAVKGALLPHFLLGIELIGENKFIINSNFANSDNMNNILRIAKSGFNIDQTDFKYMIFNTGYIRYGEVDEYGLFGNHDIEGNPPIFNGSSA